MLHKFAKIFVSLLLEAANEFILEVHDHVKTSSESQS
jgi:hypothetical protein